MFRVAVKLQHYINHDLNWAEFHEFQTTSQHKRTPTKIEYYITF
jgi:hypothetical protein